MNIDINKPKAGIISIIHSPGGHDELVFYVVTPELLKQALKIIEDVTFDDWRKNGTDCDVSEKIHGLLWVDKKISPDVLEKDFQMSWGFYPVKFMNKYEIIGMIPIEVY